MSHRVLHFLLISVILLTSFPASASTEFPNSQPARSFQTGTTNQPGQTLLDTASPDEQNAEPEAPNAPANYSGFFPGVAPTPPPGFDLSGYIKLPYSNKLNAAYTNVTIEAWIRRSGSNRQETIIGNNYNQSYWFGINAAGKLAFTPKGASQLLTSNSNILPGYWYHVAIVYTYNAQKFYINGALDASYNSSLNLIGVATDSLPVTIGYDRSDAVGSNYFLGNIDELRFWNTLRSPDQIKNGMYTSIGGAVTYLQAAYPLNGNSNDAAGSLNGTIVGGGFSFVNDGALPNSLVIPASGAPTLDGLCGTLEYSGATFVSIRGVPIALQRTATDLWVCFGDLGSTTTSASVYLDPNLTRVDPSQPEHLRFIVNSTNTRTSAAGNGSGSYLSDANLDTLWDGKFANSGGEFPSYYAEFRIPQSTLGGSWDRTVGMGFGKSGTGFLSFFMWPALAVSNQPSTWSSISIPGSGPLRTFSGNIVYQPVGFNLPDQPAGSVPVKLIGYNPATTQEGLVGSVSSFFNGNFSIQTSSSYPNFRLELGAPPKGLSSKSAVAGAGAAVIDERTIDYGAENAGTFAGNKFVLSDQSPLIVDSLSGPVYEIVAAQAVYDSGAVDEFAAYKRRLGFTVETGVLENITAAHPGLSVPLAVRAYLQNRRTAWGGLRFKYVLLIGSQTTIPHVKMAAWLDGYPKNTCADLDTEGGPSFKWSDWIYVDLTSNADSNGNGCIADGSLKSILELKPGFIPDFFSFNHDVSVGRVGLDNVAKIKKALTNSMNFEQQSQEYKQNFLAAISMAVLEGYVDGDPCPNLWKQRCMEPKASTNFDFALLGEWMRTLLITPFGYNFESLYENEAAVAGGSGIHSPTVLNETNVIAALNNLSHGWVNIGAHGNGYGTGRVHWKSDINSNSKMDFSYSANANEVGGGALFNLDSATQVTPGNGRGSIFYFEACSTADPDYEGNIASSLMGSGHAVATFAAMSVVTVGNWWAPARSDKLALSDNFYITERVLVSNMLLGDALWANQKWMISGGAKSSSNVSITLFGDPSLSFQGNPGANSRKAPWAMTRRESRGQGYFGLPGPESPKSLWQVTTGVTPSGSSQKPAPVVGAGGGVIIPAGSAFKEYFNGILKETLTLDAKAYGSAAIGADNTVYALDVNGKLYSFYYLDYYDFNQPKVRNRRWTVNLGGAPKASPVIGPDGSILVVYGSPSRLKIIRPDGVLQENLLLLGDAVGEPVMDAYRRIYVSVNYLGNGYLFLFQPFCNDLINDCDPIIASTSSPVVTPPLIAYNSVYVGRQDGLLQRFTTLTLVSLGTYNLGSQPSAGPVIGPGGQVFVGTQAGKLVSLTENLAKRWEISTGISIVSSPSFSTDYLYLVYADKLRAFNPFSGAAAWARNLTGGSGSGSAVPGAGRTVYALDGSGKAWAFGEGWLNGALQIGVYPGKISSRALNVIKWIITPPIAPDVMPEEPEITSQPNYGSAGPLDPESVGGLEAVPPTAPAAASGILLQRSLDGAEWQDVAFLPAGTTIYTDTNVTASGIYRYRVQEVDSSGQNSDFTTSEEAATLPSLPGVPTVNAVTALASDSLQITWTPSALGGYVTGYILERGTAPAGPFSTLATVFDPAHEYIDTGLAPGTTYYYRLTPFNETGNGGTTPVKGGLTKLQTLAAPTNFSAALGAKQLVTLTYGGRPQGAQAVIEYAPAGVSDWLHLAALSADTFSYIAESGGVEYRVRFVQGGADSPWAYASGVNVPFNWFVFLPAIRR